jgi:hypothetical protein
MRIGQVICGFAGFVLTLGVGQALLAQTSTAVGAVSGGVMGTGFSVGAASPVGTTAAPYTATRKTTRVRTLANGTTITHETTVKLERAEPDPALFQVPEGYTVKDRTPEPQN